MDVLMHISKITEGRLFKFGLRNATLAFIRPISRLIEVGKLEDKSDNDYMTGQLFLHRVFAYRGVILFPWVANVFDRDDSRQGISQRVLNEVSEPSSEKKKPKVKSQTWYQVLVDSRDWSHVKVQTEGVTFLNKQGGNRSIYAIPGLDYVSHEDILPYIITNGDKTPIRHDLFDKFLIPHPKGNHTLAPSNALLSWQNKNHPWLELSEVHIETTEKVKITVVPFYMGTKENQQSSTAYWWRYCVRIENDSKHTVQLRERHWNIFSHSGTLETIRGKGVVGQEPMFTPKSPAFQYCSHISLQAPRGHMWGIFRMERDDGYKFDCKIPLFNLESSRPGDESPNSVSN